MKRKYWLCLGAGLFLTAAVLITAFEPTHIGRGFLRGEAFFEGRPTSYWREVLRADGQAGTLSSRTKAAFVAKPRAVPVLLECLDDSDRNVRWPAATLLARTGFAHQVLPGLRKALRDSDPEVRLQAVVSLGIMGPDALAAVADLATLIQDPEMQVRHYTDMALWQVHVPTALQAGGWRQFTSQRWQFSAPYPAAPEEEQKTVERWGGPVTVDSFMAQHGVTRYGVAASEYPVEVVEALPEDLRNNAARDWFVAMTGATVAREEVIEKNGVKGRECLFEVAEMRLLTRFFWAGHRLYQVVVAYHPKYFNAKAADYFLDSFRLENAPDKSPPKPNLIYLLCDDLGYGDLGCFASPVIKTPHLDKLAAGGMKLTHCYSASPVCSPSRAGVLTGRNPNRLGIRDWIPANSGIYLKKDEITVARLLRSAGYRTAHVGKWHLNSKMDGSEPTPGDHGFDHWFSTQNNAAPSHENPTNFVRNGKPVGPLKGNSSTLIMDEALAFLRANKDRPVALFVWFHAPHEPVATPEEYTKLYADVGDPTKRIYYGSVTLVDHEIGRLLRELDELKLRDNTFLMFTSDNGPETLRRYKGAERSHGSPGPLRGMKLHVHEGGYRVPGIVSWPGKTKPGTVCEEPVCGLDVLPTLCELAGVKPPDDRPLDGASMLPIFQGKPVERKTPLYWQYDKAISTPWKVALRQGPWKLLADGKLEKFELYNLLDDVKEAKDHAADQPERVKAMAAEMARLHREVNKE